MGQVVILSDYRREPAVIDSGVPTMHFGYVIPLIAMALYLGLWRAWMGPWTRK